MGPEAGSLAVDAAALAALGLGALQRGDLQSGLDCLDRSLDAMPAQPAVLAIRAVGLRLMGRLDEALASCDRALALQPDFAEAWYDRGTVLQELNRLGEALASYQKAITLKPGYAEAYNSSGTVLQRMQRLEDAVVSYQRAITLRPGYAQACSNCGTALHELQRLEDALASFEQAVASRPDYAEAYANRSAVLLALKRFDAALADADRAIQLRPECAQGHTNRGAILHEVRRFDEALESYDRAIALDPQAAAAWWGKAVLKILLGDYLEGWRLYEWRWRTSHARFAREFAQPLWLGDRPLKGRTLLIHAEQGYGDMIQFCRYAPMAQALGAEVVLEAPAPLIPLLWTLPGDLRFIEKGAALPPFDLHCPTMSLPHAFGTTLDRVPSPGPYLRADPGRRRRWQTRLGEASGMRVGLAWSGSPGHRNDRSRSIPLQRMRPLFSNPAQFHCVQKEVRAADSMELAYAPISTHSDALNDFADLAALIEQMDLVIAVDTAAAHVAGALGRPVWILLPHMPDCRWMLGCTDSPWYPTATLFRQRLAGDWAGVIAEVSKRLSVIVMQRRSAAIRR